MYFPTYLWGEIITQLVPQLLVYDMSVNVNGIYYVHVCEQAR